MANRYKRKEILQALFTMMKGVCKDVYTTNRPTTKEPGSKFVVVRLPQGISPVSSIHSTAYVQLHLYYKDRANGIENANTGEEMSDATINLIKTQLVEGGTYGELITCNEEPLMLEPKSDGMGYHVTVLQFKVLVQIY